LLGFDLHYQTPRNLTRKGKFSNVFSIMITCFYPGKGFDCKPAALNGAD
jgi:hypothetical protein